MPTVSITNVGVFNGQTVETWPTFEFTSTHECADTTVNGGSCTLIPGLIDAKIDIGAAPWVFPKFAAAGVTSVVDASSETADIQAMRRAADATPGWPSYFASGSAAGVPAALRQQELSIFPYRGIEAITCPAAAEEFVSKRAGKLYQGDFIRVITDVPGLDDQSLHTLVNAAHRRGKLVIAHAAQKQSYRRALNIGCDVLTPVPIDGELDSELADELCVKGVAVIPSLSLIRRLSTQYTYPSSVYDRAIASVKILNAAKVAICAGTSANDIRGLSVNCGDGIYEELQLLVQAGMSNAEALRAATSTPAQVFRLADRGVIENGKRSDLVLLQGNPLDDLAAIRHPKKVWIDGIEFNENIQGADGVWTATRHVGPGREDTSASASRKNVFGSK